jgi:hypothetical protein
VDLFNPRNQVELAPGLSFKHGAALCPHLNPDKKDFKQIFKKNSQK